MISLRRRLVAGQLVALVLVLALLEAFADHELRRELVDQFDAATRAKARALATLVESSDEGLEFHFADENMPEFRRSAEPEYFEVRRADGTLLERSPSLGKGALPAWPSPRSADVAWALDLPDGRPGRAVGVRFDAESEERRGGADPAPRDVGRGLTLVVARSSARLRSDLLSFRLRLLGAGVALLVAGAALTSLLVRRGLAPLAQLGERAATIGPDSLTARFPAGDQPSELEPIRDRLNDLLDRLEAAFLRERRFTADAAHELRTPIAELRAAAELAVRHPDDPEAVSHAIATASSSSARMGRLVESLLLLARCEADRLPLAERPLDLAALVREVWARHAGAAADRGLVVELAADGPVVVAADPTLVDVVLNNLLANAAAYTPRGGAVRLETGAENGEASVQVRNTVEGLRREDVASLFERFWRKDAARTEGLHAGIGLAVAKEVARRLGGRLAAEIAGDATLVMTLTLPTAASPSDDEPLE